MPQRRALHPRLCVEGLESRLTPAEVGVNDFRISHMGPDGDPAFGALAPAVAYNPTGNEYLVVWSANDSSDSLVDAESEIYVQRIDAATGVAIGGRARISDMGPERNANFGAFHPAVAYNTANNEYLVVWEGDDTTSFEYEIFGQRLDAATGAEVGANDFRLSDMGNDGDTAFYARNPAVAYNSVNNEYLVVWEGYDNDRNLEKEIFGQRVHAATGAELGADVRLSDMGPDDNLAFDAATPGVAHNPASNEYLVVWWADDEGAGLQEGEYEVFGQLLNAATGAEVGVNDFRISNLAPDGAVRLVFFAPAVAWNSVNNEYLVVWEDRVAGPSPGTEFELFGQRLRAGTAAALGANFRISDMGPDGDVLYRVFDAAAAYNPTSNEYLVVWQGDDNTAPLVDNEFEIFGQRLDAATGAPIGINDFRLSDLGPNGSTGFVAAEPAVAYNGAANEFLVVWRGDDNTAPLVNDEVEVFGQRYIPDRLPQLPDVRTPPPQLLVRAFRRNGKAGVRVLDAATGEVRAVLTPFRGFTGRLRVQMRDVNDDGSPDIIVSAPTTGGHVKRRKKAFDGVTLARLPAALA